MFSSISIQNKKGFWIGLWVFSTYFIFFLLQAVHNYPVKIAKQIVSIQVIVGTSVFLFICITYLLIRYISGINSKGIGTKELFYLFMSLGIASFLYFAILSRGYTFLTVLHTDPKDIFMDFINSAGVGSNPYEKGVIYPPLVNVFYVSIGRFLDFSQCATDVRNSQMGLLLYTFYNFFALSILYRQVKQFRSTVNLNETEHTFLFVLMIFSIPMLYLIERGNSVLLALIATMYFVQHYSSGNKVCRYKAYLALAVAGSIKIAPFILGAVLIRKVSFKELIYAAGICLGVFLLPFIVTHGSPLDLLHNIMDATKLFQGKILTSDGQCISLGYGVFVNSYNFYQAFERLTAIHITGVGRWLDIIGFITTSVIVSFNNRLDEYYKITLLILLIILFPGFSNIYNLVYIFIPLILLLNKYDSEADMKYGIFFILLLFIFIPVYNMPMDWLSVYVSDKYPLTISTVMESVSCIILFLYVYIQSITITYKQFKWKFKKNIS